MHHRPLAFHLQLSVALVMNGHDRIRTLLSHAGADRIGLSDSFWTDTLSRWHHEGLDPSRPA